MPRDIGAITAIYRQAVVEETGTFELVPPDANEMAQRHARLVSEGFPFLVATSGSDVLGYAYGAAFRLRPAFRFTVEDSIYVNEAARGRGVGAALLEALIDEAAHCGFRQMVAVIGDSANIGSIRLHARAGFASIGTLDAIGWKRERWLDVVLMQRAIGAGGSEPPQTQ